LIQIDSLLSENTIPILVGGTHYYIQSIVWDTLIDWDKQSEQATNKRKLTNENSMHNRSIIKQKCYFYIKSCHYFIDSEVVDLILECLNKGEDEDDISRDLNVRLHDSTLSNEKIYEQLKLVDLQSSLKIHPNDRRKMIR
jgi:tRNA A37 N6-isopentenylltransferase MiaA